MQPGLEVRPLDPESPSFTTAASRVSKVPHSGVISATDRETRQFV